ncbi:CoA ester lyase [Fodinicurvata sp. EGI_FJ10296]|uniref:HpcH/HpaI aldolase/citrate lyase family protein n=1 Tax=Fodinicurvata sp. EGI_FJ10296 TaxID=3231908 RepID=UPI003455BE6F
MSATTRPRRSMLFMPGQNERALAKAGTLAADSVVFDLEDATAPDAKPAARNAVVERLRAGGLAPREVLVRINALDTPWGPADLDALATAGADGIVLPKVESPDVITDAGRRLDTLGAPPGLAIWCMVETPMGVLNVRELAAVAAVGGGRLAGLIMGTQDLAKDLHVNDTADRLPMVVALGTCLIAARAYGIVVIDGIHADLTDAAGLEAVCRQGADLGFDGKSLIHPKQIDAANAAFAPSSEAVDRARRIIAAHSEAIRDGRGVTVVDGRLIESLHVTEAQRLVALAEAIGKIGKAGGQGHS